MRWLLAVLLLLTPSADAFISHGGGSFGDPTTPFLAGSSDGYQAWIRAGMRMIPFTASITTGGTMTVTISPSQALGPSEVVTWAGGTTTITAFGTGTGGTGTYTVSPAPGATVASQAMTASGIPNRTTIYATLTANGTDDTSQINTALAACPAGEVVLLNTGVFKISGNGITETASGCTLRGSGPGSQTNTGINAVEPTTNNYSESCSVQSPGTTSSVYCTDATATQLIKIDRNTNLNYGVIYAYPSGDNVWSTVYTLASDAVLGAYSVTLTTTPSLSAGDMVFVDELTTSDPNVIWGPSFGGSFDNRGYGARRVNSSLASVFEVASVSGNTVTFDTPITYPFHTAYTAQLAKYPNPWIHGFGVENLFVWGGMGGNGQGNISFAQCAYCWIKNVEATWSVGSDIDLTATFNNVVRDSFVHETPTADPGGNGYLSSINGGASENLFENNIFWYGNKEIAIRNAGGGNVVAYNYMDDSFGSTYPDQPEAGVNSGHLTTTSMTLLEGNYSQNFKGDTYWGNSIFITAFRNWLSSKRAGHAPLGTYTYTDVNCTHHYGDWAGHDGQVAVSVQAYSFNQNFVGNVLGESGMALSGESSCSISAGDFATQITTTSQYNSTGPGNGNSNIVMWLIGAYQASVNTTGTFTFSDCPGQGAVSGNNWTFDNCTINTMTRTANWDWINSAELSYSYGSTSTTANPTAAVPASFYLSGRPAFWPSDTGTNPWPWVDPTTGTTYTLPAMYCFQHNEMPTCALP
jgi:hypothetical protein